MKQNNDKMLRMYEPLINEVKLYFPHIYNKMIEWKPSGPMQLIITVEGGKRYEYNSITGYVHRMPELEDSSFYEDENRWRQEFKYKFNKIMTNRNYQYKDLAEMSGISAQTISSYATGKSTPKLFVVMRLARALGCDISELTDFYMDDKEDE